MEIQTHHVIMLKFASLAFFFSNFMDNQSPAAQTTAQPATQLTAAQTTTQPADQPPATGPPTNVEDRTKRNVAKKVTGGAPRKKVTAGMATGGPAPRKSLPKRSILGVPHPDKDPKKKRGRPRKNNKDDSQKKTDLDVNIFLNIDRHNTIATNVLYVECLHQPLDLDTSSVSHIFKFLIFWIIHKIISSGARLVLMVDT